MYSGRTGHALLERKNVKVRKHGRAAWLLERFQLPSSVPFGGLLSAESGVRGPGLQFRSQAHSLQPVLRGLSCCGLALADVHSEAVLAEDFLAAQQVGHKGVG
jgi:hypothetical protein